MNQESITEVVKKPCQIYHIQDNINNFKIPLVIDGLEIISQQWLNKNNKYKPYKFFYQEDNKIIYDFLEIPNNCNGNFKLTFINFSLPNYVNDMMEINSLIESNKQAVGNLRFPSSLRSKVAPADAVAPPLESQAPPKTLDLLTY